MTQVVIELDETQERILRRRAAEEKTHAAGSLPQGRRPPPGLSCARESRSLRVLSEDDRARRRRPDRRLRMMGHVLQPTP
jgi:hypothetical protein